MRNFVRGVIRNILRLMYRVRLENTKVIPLDEAVIIAPNHINFWDPVIIGSFYPILIRAMAKKELFDNKFLGKFLSFMGAFPVDRNANDIRAIKTSLSVLKNGQSLLMFPEGTRNMTRTPLPGKAGVPLIAAKANVKIMPVTIDSTYKLFSKVRIVFHEPIDLEKYGTGKLSSQEYIDISNDVLKAIYSDIRYHGE